MCIIIFPFLEIVILARKSQVVDALYFAVVTLTTVGYGDLHPTTNFTKLFTAVYIFAGVGFIGSLLGRAGDHILQRYICRNPSAC